MIDITPEERAKIASDTYENGGWVPARYYGGDLEADSHAKNRARKDIAQAIRGAVAAEREACAMEADYYAIYSEPARSIAKAIRGRADREVEE